MKIETLKNIIASLENSASKDETRHHLGCVQITNVEMVATDGHILSRVAIVDDFLKDLKTTYVHRDQLPYLKAVLKQAGRYMPAVTSSITENSIMLDGKLISSSDVKYPNWKQFIPEYSEETSFGIDADLLLRLVKAIKSEQKRTVCKISLRVKTVKDKDGNIKSFDIDRLGPIKVSHASGNSGVVMPCRV